MELSIQPKKLFLASCIALIATSMTFAIRANLIEPLGMQFSLSNEYIGYVLGTAFWGFTLSMIFGGWLCDMLGMKWLLRVAFISHISGVILTILATGFWSLFISTLLIGIANGMVEAACNPLIATLFPTEKTKRLNQFHMWFPGGIVIGGLIGYFFDMANLGWQWQMAMILIPTAVYGYLFFGLKLPETERVRSGISESEMFAACAKPLFLFMVVCMLLTAATELGTNQWIRELLKNAGVPGILLLVFINGLMAAGRSFAGVIEHKFSVTGMLLFSAIFSAAGLYMLSISTGYMMFLAAAIFAIGICYFWPTMLGFVSSEMPETGAMGLAIISGAGMLSVSFILPYIGEVYDHQTAMNLPEGAAYLLKNIPDKGSKEEEILNAARLAGGAATLKYVAGLPLILSVAFGFLFLAKRKKQLSIQ